MSCLKSDTRVVAYRLDGTLFRVYDSASQASRSRHSKSRNIEKCLRGEIQTAFNHMWRRFPSDQIPEQIEPFLERRKTIPKKVVSYSLNGEYVKTYSSINEAAKALHKDPHLIRDCLKGKYSTAYGYLWKYQGEKLRRNKKEQIYQYSLDGLLIQKYRSVKEASLKGFGSVTLINRAIKNGTKAKGYYWKRK